MTPSDDLLVAQLKLLGEGCRLQRGNVYHLEVYQNATGDNQTNYPCYVYRKSDFTPELELTGEANVEDETFEVTCISQDSESLRCLAKELQKTYRYAFLQKLQTANPHLLDWLVDNDTEQTEFAMEQQDKGYKTATMTVRIVTDTLEGVESCL